MSNPTPADFLHAKVNIPSEMLTRDWDRVSAATRERAFFMAAVTRAEILDIFRRHALAVTRGELDVATARERIRGELKRIGYTPAPGTEGSIKDLTSLRRINTVLETNAAMAQGYGEHGHALTALTVFPAKRMVRLVPKREPRNWPQRWRVAAGLEDPQGCNPADMSAHLTHPIWKALNRFGNSYPPYDFGSGMGDKILRVDEARRLGVDKPPPAGPTDTPAEVPGLGRLSPSLNENLEADATLTMPETIADLQRELGHTVTVEAASNGSVKVVYTDPNGTRPAAAEALPGIIAARTYPGAPAHQAEAAGQYAREGPDSFTRGSDALYDLARLVHRTEPLTEAPPLWHGRSFASADALGEWVAAFTGETGLPPRQGWPFTVFSEAAEVALAMLGEPAPGTVPAILTLRSARRARDLRPALRAAGATPDVPGIFMESGVRLRVLETRETSGILHLLTEEVEP